ncbi:glycosyltransferase family A protein [Nonomuraea lactucae]|uniref:glycosyltransferase family A protein n=1 Tax=Nonomuraea lactucae TaxID=2249762 RepID=UPI00196294E8|nr:glycosyltransferase family A protein [Nonomuraea lactucae]
MNPDVLVSVGLPTYNGGAGLEKVVASVLAQDHANLQLVICDNASTDETGEVCRDLAATDGRIVYHRQPANIGAIGNFVKALHLAEGPYFRWIGDDDRLEPHCLSRSLAEFAHDGRLVMVTAQTAYTMDGVTETGAYEGAALRSDDPAERFAEMLRLLTESHVLMDPLYGLQLRSVALGIPRPVMVREDEVAAARYALAGPWGHVPEVLSHRKWSNAGPVAMSSRMALPAWRGWFATLLQARALLAVVDEAGLGPDQRRRARAAVARLYVSRQRRLAARGARKLGRLIRNARNR